MSTNKNTPQVGLAEEEEYLIEIDPNLTFEERVKRGNYIGVDNNITPANFKLTKSGKRRIVIYDPKGDVSSEEMIRRMTENGGRQCSTTRWRWVTSSRSVSSRTPSSSLVKKRSGRIPPTAIATLRCSAGGPSGEAGAGSSSTVSTTSGTRVAASRPSARSFTQNLEKSSTDTKRIAYTHLRVRFFFLPQNKSATCVVDFLYARKFLLGLTLKVFAAVSYALPRSFSALPSFLFRFSQACASPKT